jgi:nucleoside 2-deoxyribosyltransferase|tara:strand:+ start:201 stop:692 length:492 start_codon:yes stop_codon:yes gene_type:complete
LVYNVYLAGPDVFLDNAIEHGEKLKSMCLEHGLIGHFPLDNKLDLSPNEKHSDASYIYNSNTKLIDMCDGLIANIEPFRGVSADPGTAFEIGYAVAKNKLVSLYTSDLSFYKHRVGNSFYKNDKWNIEDFDMVDNLMLLAPTNNVVYASFEKAVIELAKIFFK